jgi:TetR/AcrR family transcriptional regulator, cholesterol catabolism regulator
VTTLRSLTYDDLGTAAQRERHTRILAAAMALASDGGFDRVQMRAVAEQADVALGTLYRYFPSKIHLLVSALAAELRGAREALDREPAPGVAPAERVRFVLGHTTRRLQRDPPLTEALTRAFVFADASVGTEIHAVEVEVARMLMGALRGPVADADASSCDPSEEEVAIMKVIGEVWLGGLVQWVTGRVSAEDVATSTETAVRLLLR